MRAVVVAGEIRREAPGRAVLRDDVDAPRKSREMLEELGEPIAVAAGNEENAVAGPEVLPDLAEVLTTACEVEERLLLGLNARHAASHRGKSFARRRGKSCCRL